MTRAEMEAVINKKQSVIYRGVLITRIEDLPKEEELVSTEAEREAVKADLQRQIEELQNRVTGLELVSTKPSKKTE